MGEDDWDTFEETIRRGRNRPIKALRAGWLVVVVVVVVVVVMMMMMMMMMTTTTTAKLAQHQIT